MSIEELFELLVLLKKEKMWQLYLAIYPKMTKETYMTFEEFVKPAPKISKKSIEKIEKDTEMIINAYRKGGVKK